MVPENFKENGFMIGLGLFIVVFVIAQSRLLIIYALAKNKKKIIKKSRFSYLSRHGNKAKNSE